MIERDPLPKLLRVVCARGALGSTFCVHLLPSATVYVFCTHCFSFFCTFDYDQLSSALRVQRLVVRSLCLFVPRACVCMCSCACMCLCVCVRGCVRVWCLYAQLCFYCALVFCFVMGSGLQFGETAHNRVHYYYYQLSQAQQENYSPSASETSFVNSIVQKACRTAQKIKTLKWLILTF